MSIGRLFVSIYRWLLLLLAALAVEKSLDALVSKVTSDKMPVFTKYTVIFPSSVDMQTFHPSNLHAPFICGILAILVIFMILFRYFLCLIEPITEVCRADGVINFSDGRWKVCLDSLPATSIFLVIFASMFEFLILIQASLALPSIKQWLAFLAYLALFDLCLFIVAPATLFGMMAIFTFVVTLVHETIIQGGKRTLKRFIETDRSLKLINWSVVIAIVIASIFINILTLYSLPVTIGWKLALMGFIDGVLILLLALFCYDDNKLDNWVSVSCERVKKRSKNITMEWIKLYLLWDLVDLSVIAIGGLVISCGWPEQLAVVVVFAFTSLSTALNIRANRKAYGEHLGILTLTP